MQRTSCSMQKAPTPAAHHSTGNPSRRSFVLTPSTKPRTLSTTLVSVRDANYGTSAASLVLLASRHGARECASHRIQRRLALGEPLARGRLSRGQVRDEGAVLAASAHACALVERRDVEPARGPRARVARLAVRALVAAPTREHGLGAVATHGRLGDRCRPRAARRLRVLRAHRAVRPRHVTSKVSFVVECGNLHLWLGLGVSYHVITPPPFL